MKPAHDFSEVPEALRAEPRWVGWAYVTRDDGKQTKEPRWAATERLASSTNPKTWSGFDVAVAGVAIGKHAGIGYVLGDGRAGVDLDGAIDEDGGVKAWAVRFLRHALDLGVYVERSVSGTGLHFIGRAALPSGGHNVRREGLAVEWYADGRYFTVSGDVSGGLGGDPDADMQPLIDRLESEVLAIVPGVTVDAAEVAKRLRGQELLVEASTLDPATVEAAERAFMHRAGQEMREAWDRDECAGQSEERQKLVTRIAKDVGGDPVLTAAVFARSPRFVAECRRGKMPRLLGHEVGKAVSYRKPGEERPWSQAPATPPDEPWPEPVDLWAKTVVPPLPRGIFPAEIEALATEMESTSGFDPAHTAVAALTACAAAISDDFQVEVKRGDPTWRESARLWTVIYGPPSSKKSPVIKCVTAPMDMLIGREKKRHGAAMAEHVAAAKAARKAKEEPPEAPTERRYEASNVTPEALAAVLAENPQGLLLRLPEATAFFGADSYKEGSAASRDMTDKLELYDGGLKSIDRVKTGSRFVNNWGVSLLGATQPDAIGRRLAAMPDNGIVQRVMWIAGSARPATERPVRADVLNRYGALIERLYRTAASGQVSVVMSEGASRVRREVFDRLDALIATVEGDRPALASHFGKWHGLFARVALVMHAIECDGRYLDEAEISEASARRAQRFIFDVLLPHTAVFYEAVLGAESALVGEDARVVAGHVLAKAWTEVTPATVVHSVKRWRYRGEREREAALAALVTLGWLREADPQRAAGRGQSPKSRWEVNPAVHRRFKGRAEGIRQGMEQIARVLRG